jgi:hypothetical protein
LSSFWFRPPVPVSAWPFQASNRGIHLGQTAVARSETSFKGIVPAGIEDHDIQMVFRILHLTENTPGIHGLEFNIRFGFNGRINGDEIVSAIDLNPVAGKVEQADTAVLSQPPSEIPDGEFHLLSIGILDMHYIESQISQGGERFFSWLTP